MLNTSEKYLTDFFNNPAWPDYFFIHGYPLLVIAWNLLLLLVPFYLVLYLKKFWQKKDSSQIKLCLITAGLGFLWLLFIPNAAYIITDVRHLLNYCPVDSPERVCPQSAWLIMFFFIYASIGWAAFVFLLGQMKEFIAQIKSKRAGQYFIWLVIPLISLGVLLGLIDRFHSWEFILFPGQILKSGLRYFIDIIYFRDWAVFTIGLYVLYWGGEKLFKNKEL